MLPVSAHAKTAAELQDDCAAFYQQSTTVAGTQADLDRMLKCVAYISGVLDVPLMYSVGGAAYCAPAGTTRGTVIGVVREQIRRPEVAKMTWPGSGPQVIFNAVQARWPCNESGR
ncbi:Rap1a/Tai family immunity protein [Roseateles violae]|uniref:Rap1a/Tai family immunity protein n=1 Tax=Roseateles violae TaxID=3058042 RepID=UPI003313046D